MLFAWNRRGAAFGANQSRVAKSGCNPGRIERATGSGQRYHLGVPARVALLRIETRMMGKLNMLNCRPLGRQLVAALCVSVMGSVAAAESTRFYELEGFGVLLNGNPESTALREDGAITLPPYSREWFNDPGGIQCSNRLQGWRRRSACRYADGRLHRCIG